MAKNSFSTTIAVRQALQAKGYTITSWGAQHGYSQQLVSRAIHYWIGKNTGVPRGKTYYILCGLSKTIGKPITPIVNK